MANNLPILRIPPSTRLPDGPQWINRFEVRSASSNRVYVIAQNKEKRYWGCSCPGWRGHRKCRHLAALSLPAHEQPKEVIVG